MTGCGGRGEGSAQAGPVTSLDVAVSALEREQSELAAGAGTCWYYWTPLSVSWVHAGPLDVVWVDHDRGWSAQCRQTGGGRVCAVTASRNLGGDAPPGDYWRYRPGGSSRWSELHEDQVIRAMVSPDWRFAWRPVGDLLGSWSLTVEAVST